MEKTKHTPTPWYIEEHDDYMMIYHGRSEADLAQVFAAGTKSGTIEEARATADFIVRAVNSHEKLLHSLKMIQEFLKQKEGTPEAKSVFTMCEMIQWEVDKAIAQAEGVKL